MLRLELELVAIVLEGISRPVPPSPGLLLLELEVIELVLVDDLLLLASALASIASLVAKAARSMGLGHDFADSYAFVGKLDFISEIVRLF